MDLFTQQASPKKSPLAWQLKPQTLTEALGHEELIEKLQLKQLIHKNTLPSLIFWGPPGCGKTSLAHCIANESQAHVIHINAVLAKISDIKDAIQQAKLHPKTIVFIDEIHRFSKSQQDALLPVVEEGLFSLIGATTENPYFHVIAGLCSRCQIYELKAYTTKKLENILERALLKLKDDAKHYSHEAKLALLAHAKGDARKLMNTLEHCQHSQVDNISEKEVNKICLSKGIPLNRDQHYDLTSALIKSMRGSDANAALYWLVRLLKGGEDPQFIARRLVIFASEDIGLADAQALILAQAAYQACQNIGMPEVRINLSHVVCYLAKAKKSIQSYEALKKAESMLNHGHVYPVPDHLRDGHSHASQKLGFAKDYFYPPHHPNKAENQTYLPSEINDVDFLGL